jgi:hypothetical protein
LILNHPPHHFVGHINFHLNFVPVSLNFFDLGKLEI